MNEDIQRHPKIEYCVSASSQAGTSITKTTPSHLAQIPTEQVLDQRECTGAYFYYRGLLRCETF